MLKAPKISSNQRITLILTPRHPRLIKPLHSRKQLLRKREKSGQ